QRSRIRSMAPPPELIGREPEEGADHDFAQRAHGNNLGSRPPSRVSFCVGLVVPMPADVGRPAAARMVTLLFMGTGRPPVHPSFGVLPNPEARHPVARSTRAPARQTRRGPASPLPAPPGDSSIVQSRIELGHSPRERHVNDPSR